MVSSTDAKTSVVSSIIEMESVIKNLNHLFQIDPEEYLPLTISHYYPYSFDSPVDSQEFLIKKETKVYVTERDCLEASAVMATLENSGRPLVLNMANAYNCGGSFFGPRGSQEEYLIRNTSLIASLWPHRRRDDHRWPEGKKCLPSIYCETATAIYYPFTHCGAIYTPTVHVFNFFHFCSILSLAQQDLRRSSSSSSHPFDYNLTIQNFRTLFSVAAGQGHTTLILGAIGCGVFKNPPDEICQAFAELIFPGGEFHGVFETIIFAIIKSEENLTAFERVFGARVDLESILFPEESDSDEQEDCSLSL
jgi:uncharacterized protein (TIGR02452 family)